MEKIEVAKKDGSYTYTGDLTDLGDGWVNIKTIKGEDLFFRREQIMQRRVEA